MDKRLVRKLQKWTVISFVVMLVLPFLVSRCAPHDWGMALCMILFLVVNPCYSILLGLVAAKHTEKLWFMSVIPAAAFLLGVWLFFNIHDQGFFIYAEIYLVLGVIAMLISTFIRWKKEDRR